MAAPALYVALGLVGAGLTYALTRPKGGASGSGGGSGSRTSSSSSSERLPPDLQAKFDELMARGEDPDAMDQVADRLEQMGFKADATRLRLRASQLRAAAPPAAVPAAPVAPAPAPRPAASPAPAPAPAPAAPAGPGLPVLAYIPDLAPVGSGASYFPRSVSEDAKALRFLGLAAGNPGGGVSQAEDMRTKTGAWNVTFQQAVKAFQASPFGKTQGLTVDGWVGPNTRKALGAAVASKNEENRAKNAAAGKTDAVFAGAYDPFARVVTAGRMPNRLSRVGAAGPSHGRA